MLWEINQCFALDTNTNMTNTASLLVKSPNRRLTFVSLMIISWHKLDLRVRNDYGCKTFDRFEWIWILSMNRWRKRSVQADVSSWTEGKRVLKWASWPCRVGNLEDERQCSWDSVSVVAIHEMAEIRDRYMAMSPVWWRNVICRQALDFDGRCSTRERRWVMVMVDRCTEFVGRVRDEGEINDVHLFVRGQTIEIKANVRFLRWYLAVVVIERCRY